MVTDFNKERDVVLVTGAAGFIGMHVCKKLCEEGFIVKAIDCFNSYYDVRLKYDRAKFLKNEFRIDVMNVDLAERGVLANSDATQEVRAVIHLAAQPGVRYSLENPWAYLDGNLSAFLEVLEFSRNRGIFHLVYASSSSVYGNNSKKPFSEIDHVDHPISLYAATKRSNELMAHAYSHTFSIPTTGLRFFTVYGPWGRPDMAVFKFVKAVHQQQTIELYNQGKLLRDFTYIDDIVDGICSLLMRPPKTTCGMERETDFSPNQSSAPFALFNIGNNNPEMVSSLLNEIEVALGMKAIVTYKDKPNIDVDETFADINQLKRLTGFSPRTSLKTGIQNFISWYLKDGFKYETR